MMCWIFAGITLAAVVMATFLSHTRRAILSLWVAGLGVGAMYLTLGAEFLAIIQWIVSTLVAISFVFFAVMFGEYNSPEGKKSGKSNLILTIASIVLGMGFSFVVWMGSQNLSEGSNILPESPSDLGVIGQALTQDHFLSLEVLALTLFLVLVGGGVIARSEGRDSS